MSFRIEDKFTTEFQSTLPQGERHKLDGNTLDSSGFQSTLPQGERQEKQVNKDKQIQVSIHAPARGAT